MAPGGSSLQASPDSCVRGRGSKGVPPRLLLTRSVWGYVRFPGHHGGAIPLHLVSAAICVIVILLIKNNDFGLTKISDVDRRSSRVIIPVKEVTLIGESSLNLKVSDWFKF